MLRVGVFDSGRGGMSIAAELVRSTRGVEYVYLADTAGFPFSTKTDQEVKERVALGVQQLDQLGCSVIVIACNTATLHGLEEVRTQFPHLKIIGTVPPLKPALESAKKQVFSLTTQSTADSQAYREFLQSFDGWQRVTTLGLTSLVEAIEKQNHYRVNRILSELAAQCAFEDAAVVLGCTHFPLVLPQFREVFPPSVEFFTPTAGVVAHVQQVLSLRKVGAASSRLLFTSEQI